MEKEGGDTGFLGDGGQSEAAYRRKDRLGDQKADDNASPPAGEEVDRSR